MNGLRVCCALLLIAASVALDAEHNASLAEAACSPANAKVVDAYKAPAAAEQVAKTADPSAKGASAQPAPERTRTVQLGDAVAFEVEQGESLLSEACRKKPLILYLNGLALKGVTAVPAAILRLAHSVEIA